MKKKIFALMLCVALLAVAVVGGTLAYFTDTDDAENVFTVGNVDIDLTEPEWDKVVEAEANKHVYPGEPLAKDPTVTNLGNNPCFVRISVEGLDQFTATYGADAKIITRSADVDGTYVEGIHDDWKLHTDGYYYYTKVLDSGATTPALFDQIVIPVQIKNNEEAIAIDVVAQAVQAQGAKPSFDDVQAMTVEEIAGWFTTCGF